MIEIYDVIKFNVAITVHAYSTSMTRCDFKAENKCFLR